MTSTSDSPSLALIPALELLATRTGIYQGRGTNFEGASFAATLELSSRVANHLIEIKFVARDEESGIHEELTWITPDLKNDKLCLWTVSTNTPGMLCHALAEDREDDFRERRFVFRLGDPTALSTFRQEIVLDLMRDGTLEYRYSWGVPHEKLAVRVQTHLEKTSQMKGPHAAN